MLGNGVKMSLEAQLALGEKKVSEFACLPLQAM